MGKILRVLISTTVIFVTAAAAAQQPPNPAVQPISAADAQQLCAREFGEQFKLDPKFKPLTVDLDGDGTDDLLLVATAKNPLGGELDYHYRAIDPYDTYFGFGDPKVTVQFSATNAVTTRYILVVHNWRAPQAKFVILNLPFDSLSTSRIAIKKKKSVNTIHGVELGGIASDIYWDGKKYKWNPSYVENDETSSAK
jgi:hypothetical protein